MIKKSRKTTSVRKHEEVAAAVMDELRKLTETPLPLKPEGCGATYDPYERVTSTRICYRKWVIRVLNAEHVHIRTVDGNPESAATMARIAASVPDGIEEFNYSKGEHCSMEMTIEHFFESCRCMKTEWERFLHGPAEDTLPEKQPHIYTSCRKG